jgi:hypothetical protein
MYLLTCGTSEPLVTSCSIERFLAEREHDEERRDRALLWILALPPTPLAKAVVLQAPASGGRFSCICPTVLIFPFLPTLQSHILMRLSSVPRSPL